MATPTFVSMDLGTGNGVQENSMGGTSIYKVTTGTAFGSNIQVKTTGPTSNVAGSVVGTGPGVFSKIVNGPTAQTNTITFYDANNSAACTAANAIFTLVTATANQIIPVDIPFFTGLWMNQSAAATGPLNIYFS